MKKSNFSIIYFLLLFIILDYSFYLYVGITTPGGKTYSSFLHQYLNIPYWLSAIVAKATKWMLQIAGYATYQKSPINVTIKGSRGVNIAWGCVGVGVMITWFSFVVAHKANLSYKLKWVISGVLLIYFINILRIAFITLSYYYHWYYPQSFNAHQTFNILTYIVIILLMFVFAYYYNRKKVVNKPMP